MKYFCLLILLLAVTPFLFAGTMIQTKSGEEQIQAYLAKPEGAGPFPALILIHEWWGLNDQIKGMADRIAKEGYFAVAADLYRGKVSANPDEAHQYMSGLPDDRAVRDMQALFAYLQSQKEVRKNDIGSIGWCMGGKFSLLLAVHQPLLAATVVNYGSLPTDNATLQKIQAPILGIFGEADQAITPESARNFERQMKKLNKSVEIHIYPGAGHAFMNETGGNYKAEAAKDAWAKTLVFLSKHLKN